MTIQTKYEIGQHVWVVYENNKEVCVYDDYIGWITLAMLVVNEARSIIENLVQMDVYVPEVLVKGLEVAQEKIANKNAE